jgi:transmembrane sensor
MDAQGTQESSKGSPGLVPPAIAAEAAVWIARLHGPDRSPRMEREFHEWQARSATNRLAFERCTDVWEAVPGVRLSDAYASASSRAPAPKTGGLVGRSAHSRSALTSIVALLIAVAGLSAHFWRDAGLYATRVGEQQLVVLDDGTRMSLNTDTQVRVDINADRRSVNVEAGEVLFEVAKDPGRPFVVHAFGSDVLALGTVFAVRLPGPGAIAGGALAVTLIEGQVTVRAASSDGLQGLSPADPVLLQAGQRVRLVKAKGGAGSPATQQVDRPRIDQLMAWKRSEAVFDDMALPDAISEMNRYNRTPIVLLGDASLSRLRISGQYRTGDSGGFAQAVAALHGLALRQRGGRLELSPPQ